MNHQSQHDLCVFIGRFQPLHAGHVRVIEEGLRRASRMLILVGSANEPRSFRNPFTFSERASMIRAVFGSTDGARLDIVALEDSSYNLNEWTGRVRRLAALASPSSPGHPRSIALIGHAKDATSYYLNLFPQWASIDVAQQSLSSSTDIRAQLFGDPEALLTDRPEGGPRQEFLEECTTAARQTATRFLQASRSRSKDIDVLPAPVIPLLESFLATEHYREVCDDFASVAMHRHAWRRCPRPPVFVTALALVVQSGNLLLERRSARPGKGLWALPGGFVSPDQSVEASCLGSLRSQTRIKLPEAVLQGHVVARKVFDAPHRSPRGRTIAHAFLIHLKPGPLPLIRQARATPTGEQPSPTVSWVDLSVLRRDQMFEDHYSIIANMTAPL